jgi:hypothetical protein
MPASFERPAHRRVLALLDAFDGAFLGTHGIVFGGGTRVVCELGEFRESVDLDLLCPDTAAYQAARATVTSRSLGLLARRPLALADDLRFDRYGIRGVLLAPDGTAVKLEVIALADYRLGSTTLPPIPVPALDRTACYVTKLLANSDRGLAFPHKDPLDLLAMWLEWGPAPGSAWREAERHYGSGVAGDLVRAWRYLAELAPDDLRRLASALVIAPSTLRDWQPQAARLAADLEHAR